MLAKTVKDKGMIIYIAGPMSGLPRHNYPEFWQAANRFLAHGITVLNPADLQTLPDWESYMRESLKMIAWATHIYMLPGWESSRGALVENFLAGQLGIERVKHYPCTELPCGICEHYTQLHGPDYYAVAECSGCGGRYSGGGLLDIQESAQDCCGSDYEMFCACAHCHYDLSETELETRCWTCYAKPRGLSLDWSALEKEQQQAASKELSS